MASASGVSQLNEQIEQAKRLLIESVGFRFGDFTPTPQLRLPFVPANECFVSDPKLIASVARAWVAYVADADIICAAASFAVPLASALSLETGLPLVIVRRESREALGEKILEGVSIPGQRAILVDDTIATGSTAARLVECCHDNGLVPLRLVVALGIDPLCDMGHPSVLEGLDIHWLVKLSDLYDHRRDELGERGQVIRQFLANPQEYLCNE